MRSNQSDLTKDEFEAIKQLGVAIGNAMGDCPTPHRLYAVVMYLADTIIANSPDAAEARECGQPVTPSIWRCRR